MSELNIAEIPFDDGKIHYRYSRYLSADGSRWIRHGLFRCFHPNGELASEGTYQDGHEHGIWTDYHPNGVVAARGQYENGNEVGIWAFWKTDGSPEDRG